MRFPLLSSIMVAMFLAGSALADFDLWLQQLCTLPVGPGQFISCGYNWFSSPAYQTNRCWHRLQPNIGGLGGNPCNKVLDMNGSWGRIIDCGNGSLGKADGAFYGNFDWYGSRAGCIMWTTGKSGQTCSGLPEYWMSRVACKIPGVDGRP